MRNGGKSDNSEVECSRFVIWIGAALDECSSEDRGWLAELLKSLDLESLQGLNGSHPSGMAQSADRVAQILRTLDLGRLAHAFLPGTTPRSASNSNALPLLSQSVDILGLSVRPSNCLRHAEITTIGELTKWSSDRLLEIKNMGRKSAGEITAKLEELLRNSDESQSLISVRPESFCLSTLLSFEQCGIDAQVGRTMKESGISRVDDVVTRNRESLLYWSGLSDAEVSALERQLPCVDLHLESRVPLWVRTHYSELREAFREDVEQLLARPVVIESPVRPPPTDRSTTSCFEEEVETFFAAHVNDRKKEIVRRFMGWDGGPGTTLEQAGHEFNLTRERIRQILAKSLREPTVIKAAFLQSAIECVDQCVPARADSAEVALLKAGIARTRLRVEAIIATAKHLGIVIPWSIEEWNGRRFVVNPAAMCQVQELLRAVRKRVSHCGIARSGK